MKVYSMTETILLIVAPQISQLCATGWQMRGAKIKIYFSRWNVDQESLLYLESGGRGTKVWKHPILTRLWFFGKYIYSMTETILLIVASQSPVAGTIWIEYALSMCSMDFELILLIVSIFLLECHQSQVDEHKCRPQTGDQEQNVWFIATASHWIAKLYQE